MTFRGKVKPSFPCYGLLGHLRSPNKLRMYFPRLQSNKAIQRNRHLSCTISGHRNYHCIRFPSIGQYYINTCHSRPKTVARANPLPSLHFIPARIMPTYRFFTHNSDKLPIFRYLLKLSILPFTRTRWLILAKSGQF